MSNKATARTRNDYRTLPEGSVAHYLIHVYPKGMNFTRKTRGEFSQIHDTTSDQGRYVALDGMGMLKEHPAFFDQLHGISHTVFKAAIDEIREMEGASVPGKHLVQALEWYQDARLNKARGVSSQRAAMNLGVDRSTLTRWAYQCIELIEAIVFRTNVEGCECDRCAKLAQNLQNSRNSLAQ